MSDTHRAPSAFQIERAMSAWHQIRESLATDPDLLTEDAIREAFDEARATHPEELLERLIDAVWWTGREIDDANQLRAAMIARRDRYQNRETMLRLLIQQLMDALEMKSRRGRYASASLALSSRQSVVITDADALPDEFVKVTREPMRTAIGDAMRNDGLIVPGAELSTPGVPILTIRSI
jgi:Siphovirus Gp157